MEEKNRFIESIAPDSLITIAIDGTSKKFAVSKAILCQTSEYFIKALSGNFKEASTATLSFPGWKADVVEYFLFWVHQKYLPDFYEDITKDCATEQNKCDVQNRLIDLWMFGDEHLIPKLQNEAMRHLVEFTASWFTESPVIQYGYETAPKDSALRKFILDEGRHLYFNNDIDGVLVEAHLERMARIPGFILDFFGPVKDRLVEKLEIRGDTYKSAHEIGLEAYLVEEE